MVLNLSSMQPAAATEGSMLSRKRSVPVVRVSVPLTVSLPDLGTDHSTQQQQAAARIAVVQCIAAFLATNRGLAQTSLDELRKVVDAHYASMDDSSRRRKRTPSSLRRVEKFLATTYAVLGSLHAQLLSKHAQEGENVIVLVFGASPSRAKEVYTIRFSDATTTRQSQVRQPAHNIFTAATRHLFRALLQQYQHVHAWQEPLPSGTKLHVLISRTLCESAGEVEEATAPDAVQDPDTNTTDLPYQHQPPPSADDGSEDDTAAADDRPAQRPPAHLQKLRPLHHPVFHPRPHLSRALGATTCQAPLQVEFVITSKAPAPAHRPARHQPVPGAGGDGMQATTGDGRVQPAWCHSGQASTPVWMPQGVSGRLVAVTPHSVSQLSAATARLTVGSDSSSPRSPDCTSVQCAGEANSRVLSDGDAAAQGVWGVRRRHLQSGYPGPAYEEQVSPSHSEDGTKSHTVCLGVIPAAVDQAPGGAAGVTAAVRSTEHDGGPERREGAGAEDSDEDHGGGAL